MPHPCMSLCLPLPATTAADCSAAFQRAINAAAAYRAPAPGAAVVEIPEGTWVLRNEISITSSNVVLRGAGVSGAGGLQLGHS